MSTLSRSLLALAAVGLLSASAPTPADASSRGGVSMEVLVDGRPLKELRADGRTYVEARKGRSYTIRLRNDTGGRVAVALAVDGLNSIDAKHTAARDASKWVLSPYETAEIKGWQVDDGHARKFVFTSEEKSYGTWIGDSRNLGIISAVFFAEKERSVCCVEPRIDRYGVEGRGYGGLADEDASGVAELEEAPRSRNRAETKSSGKRAPAAEPAAGDVARSGSAGRGAVAPAPPKKKDERAATGMGSRTRHEVQWTSFDLDPSPLATFDVRYAYRDELLALGIDPDWSPVTRDIKRRERAVGFAPDPGSSCCR